MMRRSAPSARSRPRRACSASCSTPPAPKRFPPLIDSLEVAPGYENALAAALGDDLDASLDREAPVHWGASDPDDADPALPEGVQPLSDFVRGPENLSRRLRQIGVAAEAEAESLQPRLAAGQRLVTERRRALALGRAKAAPGSAAARRTPPRAAHPHGRRRRGA